MSLNNRTNLQNDDFFIAISGVYLKEIKQQGNNEDAML